MLRDFLDQLTSTVRESFLHFIWQFQKFDTVQLTTQADEPVQVYAIGQYNTDAGPDFLNAKLLIDDITWYGHIELHLKSSDWNRHKHQYDDAYNNVILHVVWEHDEDVESANGQLLPTIELQGRIKPDLLKKCNQLIKSPDSIACATQFAQVKNIDKIAMLNQAGIVRLKRKSEKVLCLLDQNRGNWEETTYQLLAANFGFKTNEAAFLKLSQQVRYKTIIKHTGKPKEIEALLFGMSGFLTETKDLYQEELKTEWTYQASKYHFRGIEMLRAEWKFLRLRPGNFPTVRLAQFAALLCKNSNYFDRCIHYQEEKELRDLFSFGISPYWSRHYDFAKVSRRKIQGIGQSSLDLILVNTIAPLLVAYAQYADESRYMDKAISLLQNIKPEKNRIINMWESMAMSARDAFDSQSMIELRNEFCLKKKCLSCKIGVSLINR